MHNDIKGFATKYQGMRLQTGPHLRHTCTCTSTYTQIHRTASNHADTTHHTHIPHTPYTHSTRPTPPPSHLPFSSLPARPPPPSTPSRHQSTVHRVVWVCCGLWSTCQGGVGRVRHNPPIALPRPTHTRQGFLPRSFIGQKTALERSQRPFAGPHDGFGSKLTLLLYAIRWFAFGSTGHHGACSSSDRP